MPSSPQLVRRSSLDEHAAPSTDHLEEEPVSVQFIGMIQTRDQSEVRPPSGPVVNVEYTRAMARAHEEASFDRVLIGYFSSAPDGFIVAADALSHTDRLGVLLAHRPGFVAPTVAARKFATLDQFYGGRLAVHVISGGHDIEQRRDGDYLDHDDRYRRTDEYLEIMRSIWTADGPIDYEGKFYRFEGSYSEVRCATTPHIPIFFGGSSDIAVDISAKHADVYALWGEPLADVKAHIERVKAAAAVYGRDPGISLSLRPILGVTEDAAWDRAWGILETIKAKGSAVGIFPRKDPQNRGSQRLLEAASRGDILDERLFTPLAAATGAQGNSTALVGTPAQVAEAMLAYVDVGVTTLLIRGYDPLEDATAYGELIALVKGALAEREAAGLVPPRP
jgi:alkanesulfonate monooxygenase